jgi:pyruvate,water dikinase
MTASDTPTELRFEPPGPGSWEQDPVHFPRPLTLYFQTTHPASFKRGTNDFARFYGMLIDGLQIGYVNGFGYNQVRPAPDAEIPERFQRAEQVFAQKLWREQLRDWDETCKPSAIAMHRELQAVDPDTLSDAELVAYLTRCREHHSAMIAQHMRFTAGAVLPTGDFLAHVGDWTGLPPSELLGLMRGSAAVSAGGSDEMEHLKRAFAKDPAAHKVLASDGDPAQVLASLRSLGGETGEAVSGYLDLVGHRLIDGFDIAEPSALELPDALLRAIRIALSGEAQSALDVDARIAEVRALVPAAHQDEFDELLGEARLTYRLRDERGVYSDIWAAGLMRRAALAAGRRVAARGRLATPQHMLDATLDEMCAMVAGTGGPSADELGGRAQYRATHTAKDAPPLLGPPAPPPDLTALPPSAGRLMRAMFIALGHLFGSSQAQNEERVLYGLAASKGVYEGRARRVSGPSQFGLIAKGDVLVTESTTEAFNILLPLLGGIVTDNGGLLSHAAIVSREYGIPGVVGTREATGRIADGVLVRVDGDAGEVTLLG